MARISNNSAGSQLTQRDAAHAAKTFTSEPGYTKTPYSGFLFHVNVVFNDFFINYGLSGDISKKTVSLLIKAADLPEVQFETETYNQYNRKRIVNKRVIYQPIKLTFHDDIANNVRNMWIAYNQHYNADSSHIENAAWKYDNVYRSDNLNKAYGLDVNTPLPFLDKIEIYSMGNHEYSLMTLINPVINSAAFDDHNYAEGAKVMETTFTIEYENIVYSTGKTKRIPNFGKNNPENYDSNNSPIIGREIESDPPLPDRPIIKEPNANNTTIDDTAGKVNKLNFGNVNYLELLKRYADSNSNNNGLRVPEESELESEAGSFEGAFVNTKNNVTSNSESVSLGVGAFEANAFSISYTDSNTGETFDLSFASFQGIEFQADASSEVFDQKTQNEMALGSSPTTAELGSHLTQAIPEHDFIVKSSSKSGSKNSAELEVPTETAQYEADDLGNKTAFNLLATGIEIFELRVTNSAGEELVLREYVLGGAAVGVS